MSQLYRQLQSYAYNTVILDTETTGLDDGAEIIEIAVIDTQGYSQYALFLIRRWLALPYYLYCLRLAALYEK